MNGELQISDEELRQLTARRLPEGGGMDGEAGALREGFLALGAGLEAMASRGDEGPLAAQVKRWSRNAEANAPTVAARGWSRELIWQMLLGGALALSAVMVVAQIVRQWPGENAGALPVAAEIAKHGSTLQESDAIDPRAKRENRGLVEEASPRVFYAAGPWQDALDYEIAYAEAGMQRLTSRQRGVDGSLSEMNERLQALSQELWGGQL